MTNYIHVMLSKISSLEDKEYIFSIDRERIRLDVNRDGVVNLADLAIIAGQWLNGLSWAVGG